MTVQKIMLHFERSGFSADVHDVTAYVCPECNARLVPGLVAEQVSETIEALFKAVAHHTPSESPLPYTSLVFQRVIA